MRYLFVTGLPRSGTTVAARLLNHHPRCRLSIESHFPLDLLQAFRPSCGSDHCSQMDTVWHGDQVQKYPWQLFRLNWTCSEQPPWKHLVRAAIAGIARDCLGEYEVFGDKSPVYVLMQSWRAVVDLFPDARFIITERPLEECVESLMRAEWWGQVGKTADDAREMLELHRSGMEEFKVSGHPWLGVPLSGLQQQPEQAIADMLEFVGLDFDSYPMESAIAEMRGGPYN